MSAGLLCVDLLDSDGLRAQLRRLAPDVIVHSAAYRSPDQVEADPDAARRMNVHAPQVIAEEAGEGCSQKARMEKIWQNGCLNSGCVVSVRCSLPTSIFA